MDRRAVLTMMLSGAAFAAAPGRAQTAQVPVVLGQVGLSFYAVTGAVVQEVLERLGHRVEVREGAHEVIFPVVGRGEVDLLAAAWLPKGHATYWERYGDQALELAVLYDDARFFWGVPDYVPADLVRSVEDLAKPEVAARMERTIQGIGPGAGITVFSLQMMKEYGLEQAGYTFRTGTAADWIGAFERGAAERRWVILPTWQPQFLNQAYRIRPLEEPKGLLGTVDRAVLVAHKGFPAKVPPRTVAVLRRISLGVPAVTAMDHAVNVDKKTPREAARAWMAANAAVVEGWFRDGS
jgi:glycine betaine/proline transport system substrate-binding protein